MDKKSKGLKIALIILGLVVVLLGAYIVYDKFIKEDEVIKEETTDKQNEVIDEEEEKEEIIEKELTDRNIINILDENTKDISIGNYNPTVVENLYKEEKYLLSDKDKLLITLFNVEWLDISDEEEHYVSRETIDQKYYSLFGEYPQDSLFTDNIYTNCPKISCEKDNCYNSWACGSAETDELLLYNYKYSSKGDEYYVYQSIGVDSSTNSAIYKDVFLREIYESWDSEERYNKGASEFEIDESNYQDFSKYKWTFVKKDENNYYFESLEKIAE